MIEVGLWDSDSGPKSGRDWREGTSDGEAIEEASVIVSEGGNEAWAH